MGARRRGRTGGRGRRGRGAHRACGRSGFFVYVCASHEVDDGQTMIQRCRKARRGATTGLLTDEVLELLAGGPVLRPDRRRRRHRTATPHTSNTVSIYDSPLSHPARAPPRPFDPPSPASGQTNAPPRRAGTRPARDADGRRRAEGRTYLNKITPVTPSTTSHSTRRLMNGCFSEIISS